MIKELRWLTLVTRGVYQVVLETFYDKSSSYLSVRSWVLIAEGDLRLSESSLSLVQSRLGDKVETRRCLYELARSYKLTVYQEVERLVSLKELYGLKGSLDLVSKGEVLTPLYSFESCLEQLPSGADYWVCLKACLTGDLALVGLVDRVYAETFDLALGFFDKDIGERLAPKTFDKTLACLMCESGLQFRDWWVESGRYRLEQSQLPLTTQR